MRYTIHSNFGHGKEARDQTSQTAASHLHTRKNRGNCTEFMGKLPFWRGISMFPYSSKLIKNWGEDNYTALGRILLEKGFKVLLLCGPANLKA